MYIKNRQLIEKLLEKTTSGQIKWEENHKNAYYLKLNSNIINLSSTYVSVLGEMEPCHQVKLEILDSKGNEIDSVNRIKLSEVDTVYKEDYRLMNTLFNVASRSARDLDNVIDNILDELS